MKQARQCRSTDGQKTRPQTSWQANIMATGRQPKKEQAPPGGESGGVGGEFVTCDMEVKESDKIKRTRLVQLVFKGRCGHCLSTYLFIFSFLEIFECFEVTVRYQQQNQGSTGQLLVSIFLWGDASHPLRSKSACTCFSKTGKLWGNVSRRACEAHHSCLFTSAERWEGNRRARPWRLFWFL